MKYLVALVLGLFLSTSIIAQPEDGYVFENKIYVDYIKTVKFHIGSLPLSMPIIDLANPSPLLLTFDDLSQDVNDYAYTIIHCNADWKPSSLSDMEYIEGYTEADIEEYQFAFNTFTAFTNYQMLFPNEDMTFTKSGNYILLVYNNDTDEPIFTRRFCIVEPQMQILAKMGNTADVSKLKTHHEIDFDVRHRGVRIQSPQTEIQATIIQNNQWHTAISGIRPLFIRPEVMRFDFQDKIVFPAGNEYRNLNLRSFQYRTENMFDIQDSGNSSTITLKLDEKREFEPYSFISDLNGGFVIENNHFDNFDLESDYGTVVFTLQSNSPFYNSDVYIVGSMNDWELTDDNKMTYDESYRAYQGDVFLKQGFHNYMYAVKDKSTGEISYQATEGNFFQTENSYNIFIYYRPFGERYDRLVAVQTANSNIR